VKTAIDWLWDQAEACCADLQMQLAEQELTKRGMLSASDANNDPCVDGLIALTGTTELTLNVEF
jgi:hypothetical protein